MFEHIYETKIPLEANPKAWERYRNVFDHIHHLLRPGGALVFTDASRSSLWSLLRRVTRTKLRSPLSPSTYWEIHQKPQTWFRLARDSGFLKIRLTWRVPYPLRIMPWVADNGLFQYFTFASFTFSAFKD